MLRSQLQTLQELGLDISVSLPYTFSAWTCSTKKSLLPLSDVEQLPYHPRCGQAVHGLPMSVQFVQCSDVGCYTAGVGAVAYLMRADVRTGASTFRRNLKVIRGWLEEQGSAAQQCAASVLCPCLWRALYCS